MARYVAAFVFVVCALATLASARYHEKQKKTYHRPIIVGYGVPMDTPEVMRARREHLAAHVAAKRALASASPVKRHSWWSPAPPRRPRRYQGDVFGKENNFEYLIVHPHPNKRYYDNFYDD